MNSKKENKPYSAARWNEPIAAKVTGKKIFSEKEKAQNERKFREFLKQRGILKNDD